MDAEVSTACTQAIAELAFDFEGGTQGFIHDRMPEVEGSGTTWTFDHWQHGGPTGLSCSSGSSCWGTNLTGNYIQCGRGFLRSPTIDLSDCAAETRDVEIAFDHNYDFWTGDWNSATWFDGGIVEISSDGTSWTALDMTYPGTVTINPSMTVSYACVESSSFYVHGKSGFVGSSSGWVTATATIPAALLAEPIYVRWSYSAGVSSQTTSESQSMNATRPGWYIDNLRFSLP